MVKILDFGQTKTRSSCSDGFQGDALVGSLAPCVTASVRHAALVVVGVDSSCVGQRWDYQKYLQSSKRIG